MPIEVTRHYIRRLEQSNSFSGIEPQLPCSIELPPLRPHPRNASTFLTKLPSFTAMELERVKATPFHRLQRKELKARKLLGRFHDGEDTVCKVDGRFRGYVPPSHAHRAW